MGSRTNRAALAALATVTALTSAASAAMWDGSANTSWNSAANWAGDAVPADIALFTNSGIAAGATITLDAPQTVTALSFDTTRAFTIGNAAGNTAGHTLTLTNVDRSAASSGVQILTSDVVLAGDSTWTIDGSSYLQTAKVSGSGALVKQGAGELRFGTSYTAFQRTAPTTINEGMLSITGAMEIGSGAVTVGDGTHSATFAIRWGNNWNFNALGDSAALTVRNAGIIDCESYYTNTGVRFETIGSLTMEAGSQLRLGKFQFAMSGQQTTNITLRGGTITSSTGALAPLSGFIVVDSAATEMPVIGAQVAIRQQYVAGVGNVYTRFNTNDVASLPVDLKVTGVVYNGWDNRDGFDKLGAGVMKVTGSSTYGGRSITEGCTRVQAGTLLVDNTSGSGTGSSYVTVSGGATLGGIGTIGGLASATNANVSLTGTDAEMVATLAPGTIDDATGAHLLGKLTVGSAVQNNAVTFGNFSRLLARLGSTGTGDLLDVVGDLNLNSAGSSDALVLETVPGDTLSGEYTLVTFSGALTGRFDSVTLNGGSIGSYLLEYRDSTGSVVSDGNPITAGSLVLVVPEPTSASFVVFVALGALSLRKRFA